MSIVTPLAGLHQTVLGSQRLAPWATIYRPLGSASSDGPRPFRMERIVSLAAYLLNREPRLLRF